MPTCPEGYFWDTDEEQCCWVCEDGLLRNCTHERCDNQWYNDGQTFFADLYPYNDYAIDPHVPGTYGQPLQNQCYQNVGSWTRLDLTQACYDQFYLGYSDSDTCTISGQPVGCSDKRCMNSSGTIVDCLTWTGSAFIYNTAAVLEWDVVYMPSGCILQVCNFGSGRCRSQALGCPTGYERDTGLQGNYESDCAMGEAATHDRLAFTSTGIWDPSLCIGENNDPVNDGNRLYVDLVYGLSSGEFYFDGGTPASLGACYEFYRESAVTGEDFCIDEEEGEAGQAWNLMDRHQRYHVAEVLGGILYQRSNFSVPPFAVSVQATTDGTDARPRMVYDWRDSLHLVYQRGADVLLSLSHDDGSSWSAGVTLFTAASRPTVVTDPATGATLYAAYKAGTLRGRIQYPGDTSPGAEFTFKNSAGTDLGVEDDSFQIAPSHDGPNRWLLVCRKSGAADPSSLFSTDNAASWTDT